MASPVDIPPKVLRGAARLLHKHLETDGEFGTWSQHSEKEKQAWEEGVYAVVVYLLTHGGGIVNASTREAARVSPGKENE